MPNNFRTLLTTAAVLAALAGGSVLYAQADSANSRSPGGMMQGGQGGMPNMMGQMNQMGGAMQGGQGGMPNMTGMMNMMGQMNQMMETCNNMMKGMAQDRGPETPNKRSPENKD